VVTYRGASEEGAIPVSHLGYRRFGDKGLQLTNSRDHESRKVIALRPELCSCGDVRRALGVKLRSVGFHEGPVDWIREVPIRIQRSRFGSRRI
jgi:hypothetical protein